MPCCRRGCTQHINYMFSCEGNKTLSVYVTAVKKCKGMKYIMMIDNDVMLPKDLYIPMEMFTDPQMQAPCYTRLHYTLPPRYTRLHYTLPPCTNSLIMPHPHPRALCGRALCGRDPG